VFRDSRGVVHTVASVDPLQDLPGHTATSLCRALLRPDEDDLGGALERCEAVRELLERWQDAFFAALPDAVDLEEEARWAAEAGLSLEDVEATYGDDDDLDEAEDDEDYLDDPLFELDPEMAFEVEDPGLTHLLPEELVSILERELLLLTVRFRLEALVAAADLVSGWSDLLADQEKLLGHLVLAHHVTPVETGHEALARLHARLHAEHGPGHPAP
jgi:hypothetical protein